VLDVHRGWVRALRRAGMDVIEAGHDERLAYFSAVNERQPEGCAATGQDVARVASEGLLAKAYLHLPDVVLITSGFFVPTEAMDAFRARGHKVVVILTESPYEDLYARNISAHADLAIINDPTNLDWFREAQPQTYYMPHAYDPDVHYPREPEPDNASELCWIGTAYPSRVAFWEAVDLSGLDVKLGGNWQALDEGSHLHKYLIDEPTFCIDNDDTARMYASTKASVNMYRREATSAKAAQGWAMGPREVELAACKTFFATESRPENRQVLPMVPVYSDPDDFSRKLRWWLAHDQARTDVVEGAFEAIKGRTFDHSVAFMLDALDNLSR
jgi:spore maturation protein CgeB